MLTIAVPTYNRPDSLLVTVTSIVRQMTGHETLVELLVLDNASDLASEKVKKLIDRTVNASYIRHDQNIGMDANILSCFEAGSGDYLWILGDDDYPNEGCIPMVLNLIHRFTPPLIFLEPKWFAAGDNVSSFLPEQAYLMSSATLARQAGPHLSFLSSVIVNRNRFLEDLSSAGATKYRNSMLPHLAWVFHLLDSRANLLCYVPAGALFATAGNSGGYGLFDVFGKNICDIVDAEFAHERRLRRIVKRRMILNFLAGLVWNYRFASAGKFVRQDVAHKLTTVYDDFPLLHFLLLGVARFGKTGASIFRFLLKMLSLVVRIYDRLYLKAAITVNTHHTGHGT